MFLYQNVAHFFLRAQFILIFQNLSRWLDRDLHNRIVNSILHTRVLVYVHAIYALTSLISTCATYVIICWLSKRSIICSRMRIVLNHSMEDNEATTHRNANCDFNVVPIVSSRVDLKCFNGRATAARFYIGLCIMPRRISSPTRETPFLFPRRHSCQSFLTILSLHFIFFNFLYLNMLLWIYLHIYVYYNFFLLYLNTNYNSY